MAALAVLEQGPRPHRVLPKLEHAHEAVAHHAVLFPARAAGGVWRGVILRKSNSHTARNASSGQARQLVAERNLGEIRHVGMSLQSVNLAPRHFPIAIQ